MRDFRPLIGITLGDPAGIGPEIVLKALQTPAVQQALRPLIFGNVHCLRQAISQTALAGEINLVDENNQPDWTDGIYNLVPVDGLEGPVEMGLVSGMCGQAAYSAIQTAISWAMATKIDALVTAPINKASLQLGQVAYIDHTEILAHLTATAQPMTLFAVDRLRIFFLTKHIPLRRVADVLTVAEVVKGLAACDRGLQQLGFSQRRLALAALNPHASDDGLFGDEESRILAPAVAQATALGLSVFGPVPADAVFHQCIQGDFDAVLALYHDQGHIAAKTYDFHRTVSFTLGLPFLRTTPDHGTAFAIAGRNQANPSSMVEALLAAAQYSKNRSNFH